MGRGERQRMAEVRMDFQFIRMHTPELESSLAKRLCKKALRLPHRALVLASLILIGLGALHASAQTSSLVFYKVDVFDGYRMLRNQTVVVENGMIREVRASGVRPPSAIVIDGTGKTLLPGLIDAHCHISGEESLEQAAALGVTTELDMFGYPKTLVALRTKVESGAYPNAADFRTAGIGASAPGGHPSEMGGLPFPAFSRNEDAQAFVDARFAEGSDYLKIIYDHTLPGLSFQQLRDLVAAAHKRNKLVAAHETVQHDGLEAIEAGADDLEHVFDDSPITSEFLSAAVANHIIVTPTLAVISAVAGRSSGPEVAKDPRFAPYLVAWAVGILNVKLPAKVTQHHHYEWAQAAVRALHHSGINILAGTDAPNPDTGYGISMHVELALLTECGLTPEEALHAATAAPAKEFQLIDRGRIQAGRRADLLLVEGDPSKDIRATRNIVDVWKAGVKIDRQAVARLMEASRKKQ
jgi:imidazolonepropionase-like amidohydrolase